MWYWFEQRAEQCVILVLGFQIVFVFALASPGFLFHCSVSCVIHYIQRVLVLDWYLFFWEVQHAIVLLRGGLR